MKLLIILCILFVIMLFITCACCIAVHNVDRIAEAMYAQHIKTENKDNEDAE